MVKIGDLRTIQHVGSGRENGWTFEMGTSVVTLASSVGSVSFPTPFDYAPNLVVFDGDPSGAGVYVNGIVSWSATGFSYRVTGQSTGLHRVNWLACGYRGD